MPFDSSGTFVRAMNWQADAASGIKILASRHDTEDDGFASGLSTCITKDGRTSIVSNIPFNGKNITNLANPVNPQDAATKNYADSIRNFASGTTLTGSSTGSSPSFVSTAFIGFTEADLSIVARKADPGMTPPQPDRLMLNSTVNGLGPDIGALDVQTALSRNRIVNGAFQISQENGSTGGNTNGYYLADQWYSAVDTAGLVAFDRSPTIAGDPSKYVSRTIVGTARASLTAGQFFYVGHKIEGIRIADLFWGTAQAKPVILRFSIYGTPGTYTAGLNNAAGDRSYVTTFTISTANTWQDVTLKIPGPTSGTFANDNTLGLLLQFCFAAGSTYTTATANAWVSGYFFGLTGQTNGWATVNNTWRIANVGLYLDSNNTGLPPAWEMPDEAAELIACQRYWEKVMVITSLAANVFPTHSWQATKRTSPALSASFNSGSGGTFNSTTDPSGRFYQNVVHTTVAIATVTGNARM